MVTPSQRELFTDLLRKLRSAGPIGRLRLLGRGVDALRGLSPWDRKMLLRMAGFEGAESLIERLATDDEETAARFTRLLGEIESDPDRLQATARALADPERRGEAVDSLLASLDAADRDDTADSALAALHEEETEEAGAAEEAAEVEATPRPAASKPAPTPAQMAATAAAARPPAPTPAPPPPVSDPPPPPKPESDPWATTFRQPTREKVREPVEPPPAPSLAAPSSLAEVSGRNVMRGLLGLRRRIEAGETVSEDELRHLLDGDLSPPWARRRALSTWIAGGGADLDAALPLIAELTSSTGRSWCLADLAASRSWSDGAWRKILAAAPDAATRRRLERRRVA